jgi:RNA polymerase sigma-70 factor (ECF subfamily)
MEIVGKSTKSPDVRDKFAPRPSDRLMDPATLVQLYAPAVFGLCRAMVRDTQLAEDLSQDTFARAFAAIESFRGEASPRTWLLKIARNRCLDHLDHVKRAPWGRDPDPEPDDHAVDEPAAIDMLANREDAERAMSVLGESERALVVLHFGHGVGYPELAASFGIGQGAVRMRVSRALARMRDALVVHDDFESLEEECSLGGALSDDFADDLDLGADESSNSERLASVSVLYDDPSPRLWQRLYGLAQNG